MWELTQIGFVFTATMAFLAVFHTPSKKCALVVTSANLLNALLLASFWKTPILTGLDIYLFLSALDLVVMSLLIHLYNVHKQPIMVKVAFISMCFIFVNLGTSWAMLNHVGNIFYHNYVIVIFALNIIQGLLFGKSGLKGFKNGLHTMVNVLGNVRWVYNTNGKISYYQNKTP